MRVSRNYESKHFFYDMSSVVVSIDNGSVLDWTILMKDANAESKNKLISST